MAQIELKIFDDKVKVVTPYHEAFVTHARNLRGKWKDGAWWFDDSILEYVRDVMMECFGTTGEIPYDECTLLVKDFSDDKIGDSIILFGRTIAKAFGRDSGARLGEGIVFIKGDYSSGGSTKNWKTVISNATFEIHNFPIPSLQLLDVKEAIREGWCEVKSGKKKSHEDILKEIEDLEARIEALKNML